MGIIFITKGKNYLILGNMFMLEKTLSCLYTLTKIKRIIYTRFQVFRVYWSSEGNRPSHLLDLLVFGVSEPLSSSYFWVRREIIVTYCHLIRTSLFGLC